MQTNCWVFSSIPFCLFKSSHNLFFLFAYYLKKEQISAYDTDSDRTKNVIVNKMWITAICITTFVLSQKVKGCFFMAVYVVSSLLWVWCRDVCLSRYPVCFWVPEWYYSWKHLFAGYHCWNPIHAPWFLSLMLLSPCFHTELSAQHSPFWADECFAHYVITSYSIHYTKLYDASSRQFGDINDIRVR